MTCTLTNWLSDKCGKGDLFLGEKGAKGDEENGREILEKRRSG